MSKSSARYEGNHRAFITQEIAFPQVALGASFPHKRLYWLEYRSVLFFVRLYVLQCFTKIMVVFYSQVTCHLYICMSQWSTHKHVHKLYNPCSFYSKIGILCGYAIRADIPREVSGTGPTAIIRPNVGFFFTNLYLRPYCMLDPTWGMCQMTLNSRSRQGRINHILKVIGYIYIIKILIWYIQY